MSDTASRIVRLEVGNRRRTGTPGNTAAAADRGWLRLENFGGKVLLDEVDVGSDADAAGFRFHVL